MAYIKLSTDNKERKRLTSHSIIQEFDDSDASTTPILKPHLSGLSLTPKNIEIVRWYEPTNTWIDQGRYDRKLSSTLKKDTYIFGECVSYMEKEEFKIRVLANRTSHHTPEILNKITFLICSADVEKPVFYSGNVDNRQLRTDIYLSHQEFAKLENSIEKQIISHCYIKTYFDGLYCDKTMWEGTDDLYYLPDPMDVDVKKAELINENSDNLYERKLEMGNILHLEKNKPLSQVEFTYRIEQNFIEPNNEK